MSRPFSAVTPGLDVVCRIKRAEDEPKCEALRQENTALMEQVISYKEKQMGFLQDVEGLKQEKAALVAEKVRRRLNPHAYTWHTLTGIV